MSPRNIIQHRKSQLPTIKDFEKTFSKEAIQELTQM